MKYLLLFSVLLLFSCGKSDNIDPLIIGEWESFERSDCGGTFQDTSLTAGFSEDGQLDYNGQQGTYKTNDGQICINLGVGETCMSYVVTQNRLATTSSIPGCTLTLSYNRAD